MTEQQATLADDPLHGSSAVREFLGDTYPRVLAFAELLAEQGPEKGLIGPREPARLWERHILNSAAVMPFLPDGVVADVGSGAGLPGMVLAAMDPSRDYVLIEPMERRVQWLFESSRHCGIDNVRILRGRAEEVAESVEADAITARAVAAVDKLVKWCSPLLSPTGSMVLLKGRSAQDEIDRAKYTLRKHRLVGEVHEAGTIEGVEPTTVVTLTRV
ncbi:16S rRNA (guanine(527)-N(7))-methyltransferase RsmG [Demequina sp. SYSU T00039]|uniref:Ribosomal RNA small subunit methyltransferase G n=1 Tax=Demequina lignilytica TaxID=3051663 RepID=A0AAW7M2W5_9MICO|nr:MULTISPECIES: 16S rRNA (guanine(527)-N(7))-methyltransferase RsmG [unclassified Demequina]MDN4477813.1 16S rRNA (guanine(527)-N(7))-methyltransferase RsmG [Demequina sp. SYSU T00039-1]MDN4487722.1 16S rRNA (guanine(527)-N(7))-methyltransferase RsmG [Demequina sp. SYSU T00039]MDN4490895.1 16S rRNA (guanine(527)-N(7))-methyltransferase RsmG [Demequina sp. SYSU T00068]